MDVGEYDEAFAEYGHMQSLMNPAMSPITAAAFDGARELCWVGTQSVGGRGLVDQFVTLLMMCSFAGANQEKVITFAGMYPDSLFRFFFL